LGLPLESEKSRKKKTPPKKIPPPPPWLGPTKVGPLPATRIADPALGGFPPGFWETQGQRILVGGANWGTSPRAPPPTMNFDKGTVQAGWGSPPPFGLPHCSPPRPPPRPCISSFVHGAQSFWPPFFQWGGGFFAVGDPGPGKGARPPPPPEK